MRVGFAAMLWGTAAFGAAALIGAGGAALAESDRPPAETGKAETAPPGEPEAEQYFDAQSWRALVEGKTLTYQVGWGVMGREWYEPGTDRVVYVYFDGRCYDGTWSEAGGVFCFRYDGEFCFEHFRRGDDLIARETDGDEQIITEITNQRLSCKPDLTS